jgi:hypothetical protein
MPYRNPIAESVRLTIHLCLAGYRLQMALAARMVGAAAWPAAGDGAGRNAGAASPTHPVSPAVLAATARRSPRRKPVAGAAPARTAAGATVP